jgi:hypothetical protein
MKKKIYPNLRPCGAPDPDPDPDPDHAQGYLDFHVQIDSCCS